MQSNNVKLFTVCVHIFLVPAMVVSYLKEYTCPLDIVQPDPAPLPPEMWVQATNNVTHSSVCAPLPSLIWTGSRNTKTNTNTDTNTNTSTNRTQILCRTIDVHLDASPYLSRKHDQDTGSISLSAEAILSSTAGNLNTDNPSNTTGKDLLIHSL